jgi:hypothetical protein
MRRTFILFACAILCCGFAGAQSTESVCDGEQGAAYGLCNAFCDAMDCDSDDPQASETACNKVKSKFQQVTGNEPPCLAPPLRCRCYEEMPGYFAAVNSTIVSCYEDPSVHGVWVDTADSSIVYAEDYIQGDGACGFYSQSGFGDLSITGEEARQCETFLRARAAAVGLTCN